MSTHLTPLQVCERQVARIEDLSRIGGRSPKTAYLWRRAAKDRDAGDLPSARIMRSLLEHAKSNGKVLKPEWLIFGADEEEIAAAEAGAVFQRQCAPMEAAE